MSAANGNRTPEIVFFDLETTVPIRTGKGFRILEFGAIVVCPRKLVELESYCTLIRPADLLVVPVRSGRIQGITRADVAKAPPFDQVAEKIFSILDGRIWAGHNIRRFDCARIREAFASIDMPAPTPAGMIDSLGVLTEKFGRRAGDMKMATLATYFGLGQQQHRSLDDVRMNLEVLKHCATVLFLESNLPPSMINGQSWRNNSNVTTRSRSLHMQHIPNTIGSFPCLNNNTSSMRGRDEISRKSPPSTSAAAHSRVSPYTRGSWRKMTYGVKNILSCANSRPLNNILRHSRPLIR